MQTRTVEIFIMSHNRSWSLLQTVASIREFTRWPYMIIVQDHASRPAEQEHINQLAAGDTRIRYLAQFLSCNEGRRAILPYLSSEYVMFLDDDVRVGPQWLDKMMTVMLSKLNAGAVVGNIFQDDGRQESGIRRIKGGIVYNEKWGYLGRGEATLGGATLYRTDIVRKTEFRPEFNAGFEDWDQTLQMTQNLGCELWGSDAGFLHVHQHESRAYALERWRWPEIMDSALAMYHRWGVRTAVQKTLSFMMKHNVKVRADQWQQVIQIGL